MVSCVDTRSSGLGLVCSAREDRWVCCLANCGSVLGLRWCVRMDRMVRCLAICYRGLDGCCCTRRDRMVRCFAIRCSGLLRGCARRDRMVRCFAIRCDGLGLRCCTRRYCTRSCYAKSAPLAPIHPHRWLVYGQGHHPCPHSPARPWWWAKAHDVRAAALGGKIPSLRTLGYPYFPSPQLW